MSPIPGLAPNLSPGIATGLEPDLTPHTMFTKRDISDQPLAIVTLCICGAGIGLVMAYGIGRFFTKQKEEPPMESSAEQIKYMREVRERNLNGLMASGAHARHLGGRADVQSFVSNSTVPRR